MNAKNIRALETDGLQAERQLVARLRTNGSHRPPPPPQRPENSPVERRVGAEQPIPIELEEAVVLSWRLAAVWLRILWSLARNLLVQQVELVRVHSPHRPPERRYRWDEVSYRNPPPPLL